MTMLFSFQNCTSDVSILRLQELCTASDLCVNFLLRIWPFNFRVRTTAFKNAFGTCRCYCKEFALQVSALNYFGLKQNLDIAKTSRNFKEQRAKCMHRPRIPQNAGG